MKILIVSEYQYGNGAAIAAWRLADALARAGHRVVYAFYYPRPAPDSPRLRSVHLEKGRSFIGKAVHRSLFRLHERLAKRTAAPWIAGASRRTLLAASYRLNRAPLKRLIRRFQPDILSIHNVSLVLGHDDISCVSRQVPVCWTMHDCMASHLYAYRFRDLEGATRTDPSTILSTDDDATKRLFRLKSRVHLVGPSRWIADEARAVLPRTAKVSAIPNGIDTDTYAPLPKPVARERLDLPADDKFVMLFVSTNLTHERKNFRVLPGALEKLDPRHYRLLCLGRPSPELSHIRFDIQYLGSLSVAEELCLAYSAADLLVIPSLIDNLPNTIAESLLCGTPVLGANVGGIPEMVIENETGWLFDPYSADDLARQIDKLQQSRERVSALSVPCSTWARDRYSYEVLCRNYIGLFQDLAQGKKDSPE